MSALELRIPPMLVALVAGVLIWITDLYAPGVRFDLPMRAAAGAGIMVAGLAVGVAGVVSFRRARTTVNPMRVEAASALVVSGIFRFTRNPMYLGALLVLLGLAVRLGSVAGIVWLFAYVAFLNRFQIAPEEKALRARFGAEFDSYCMRVRRWI